MALPRPATTQDIGAMWALRTRAVRAGCAAHYASAVIDAWCAAAPPERLPDLLQAGGGLVTEVEGAMAGYAVLDVATGEVDAMFVEPALQGRGIARELMAAIEALAGARGIARLFLSASLNAVPFYLRVGFVAVREELYPHRSGLALPSVFMEKRGQALGVAELQPCERQPS
jgi:putative acetyltransferase